MCAAHLLLAVKLVKNSTLQLRGVLAANPCVLRYRAPSNQRLNHGALRQFNLHDNWCELLETTLCRWGTTTCSRVRLAAQLEKPEKRGLEVHHAEPRGRSHDRSCKVGWLGACFLASKLCLSPCLLPRRLPHRLPRPFCSDSALECCRLGVRRAGSPPSLIRAG